MDERDQYREVYRSAREGLALLSDRLTEPERDAILREAARKAKQKESFWFAVALVGGGVLYLVFDAFSSISQYKLVMLVGYFGVSSAITVMKNRRSRIQLIAKEVMAILKRKRLRPPSCLCCQSHLIDDGSSACAICGCQLVEQSRVID